MRLVRDETGAMLQSLMLGALITVGISVAVPVVAQRYFGGEGFDPSDPLSGELGHKVYQGKTIADMRSIGTATVGYFLKTGRYPEQLDELVDSGYLDGFEPTDGWGNDWVYQSDGRHFVLVSLGSDGRKGPQPPDDWTGEPWEADLIVRDGDFLQMPERGRDFGTVSDTVSKSNARQQQLRDKTEAAIRGQK